MEISAYAIGEFIGRSFVYVCIAFACYQIYKLNKKKKDQKD